MDQHACLWRIGFCNSGSDFDGVYQESKRENIRTEAINRWNRDLIQTKESPGFSETEPFFHGIETLLRLDAVHRIFISDMPESPYNENKDKDQ